MADHVEELRQFLSDTSRPDLQSVAVDIILGLSGTPEGCDVIMKEDGIVYHIVRHATEVDLPSSLKASQVLVNVSAIDNWIATLLTTHDTLMQKLLQVLLRPKSVTKENVCMTLSNITRHEKGSSLFGDYLFSSPSTTSLDILVDLFDKDTSGSLDYLAEVFSNITQLLSFRQWFLSKPGFDSLLRLFPYTRYMKSVIRRSGIIGLLRNLCFEIDHHKCLLGEESDFLCALLLPLAGPESFTDEENDQLPLECQYLPDDKVREDVPDLRKKLLESLLKLCVTPYGRHYLRRHGVYFILRELHKWEPVPSIKEDTESVVSILISDEPQEEITLQ